MHPLIDYEVATARIADLRRQAHHDALARAAAKRAITRAATRQAPDCGQPPPRRPAAPVREAAVDVAARTGPAGRPGYRAAPTSPSGTHRDVPVPPGMRATTTSMSGSPGTTTPVSGRPARPSGLDLRRPGAPHQRPRMT